MSRLLYALVTPARDDAANLHRLARSVEAQTVPPTAWVIVENGSKDDTAQAAEALARRHDWVVVVDAPASRTIARGAPIVRAFHAGLARVPAVDVVVKLDADVSFGDDYFERILSAFAGDPTLGIASGAAYELEERVWVRRHMTGESAWGAVRAYRRPCLDAVLPLEERFGWDTVDAVKARLAGWRTTTLSDVPFYHHRPEGERDGYGSAWDALGRCSQFMGYRFSYQLIRTLHQVRRDPRAVRLMTAYLAARIRGEPQVDADVVRYLREQQRLRNILARRREALGRATAPGSS